MDRKLPTKGVHLWALLIQHMQDCVAKNNLYLTKLAQEKQQQQQQQAETIPAHVDPNPSAPQQAEISAEAQRSIDASSSNSVVGSVASPEPLSEAPPVPPTLREAAIGFQNAAAAAQSTTGKRHGIHEADLQFLYRLFRHTIDVALQVREVSEILALDELPKFRKLIGTLIPLEVNIVLYTCPLLGNLVSFADVRERSCGSTLLDVVLDGIAAYPTQRQVVHLCLMTVSNIALVQNYSLSAAQARQIANAVIPLHGEAPVVEAWASALCNLANIHSEVIPVFISCNAIEILERLLLFFGDDARVVTRGLQALSNLCSGFVVADR